MGSMLPNRQPPLRVGRAAVHIDIGAVGLIVQADDLSSQLRSTRGDTDKPPRGRSLPHL